MHSGFEGSESGLADDRVEQMLVQAERLSRANGGVLDDSAILAVAEATNAPVEYVRLAARLMAERRKPNLIAKIKASFMVLEPEVRRYVAAGICGIVTALAAALEKSADVFGRVSDAQATLAPVYGTIKLLVISVGLWNIAVSRDRKTASICGAIMTGVVFAAYPVFAFLMHVRNDIEPWLLIPIALAGALGGLALSRIVARFGKSLGLQDPVKERQVLLRQLHDLREKLHSGEQSMTFLSVDIVGSTRMKEVSDPLSVEFTFNEYQGFVDSVTKRYGGRVHSTAGDGATCAFDHPQQAFGAARNLQAGMIEINTYRNKIGLPLRIRCGIHTGTVMAPDTGDVTTLNFAHVIDIAAHLQKVCPDGGVVVSEPAAAQLPGGAAAVGIETVQASGVTGLIWAPKRAVKPSGGPPPLPPSAAPPIVDN